MIFSANSFFPTKAKRMVQSTCSASIILVFTSMSALAFDGSTQGECYDYVVDGCNEKPECTAKELGFLLTSCDAYPATVKTRRPSFTAKPPTKKVVNSSAYKRKIKKLKADIRRK